MNKSEKVITDQYTAKGYFAIKDGMTDIVAVKDHGDHGEIIFDEVKTNRLSYQTNQKRAIAILEKLEGKPVYIKVKRSRVLV